MWKQYYSPLSLADALALLQRYGADGQVMAGGTDLVLAYSMSLQPMIDAVVDVSRVPELQGISVWDGTVQVGAAVTVSEILGSAPLQSGVAVLWQATRMFAGPQIRNVATLGGNIVNASPAADLVPALLALNARIAITGPGGEAPLMGLGDFLLGYRKTALHVGELVTHIEFALPSKRTLQYFRKVQPRHSMAIALLNLAVVVRTDGKVIKEARLAMGAVAPTAVRLRTVEKNLRGCSFRQAADDIVYENVDQDISPISDFRASAAYRLAVSRDLLQESVAEVLRSSDGVGQEPGHEN